MSNLTVRVLVAAVAIPLIVGAAYYGGPYFFLFTTILIVASSNEFYSLAKRKGIESAGVVGIAASGVLNGIAYASGPAALLDFLVCVVPIVLLAELGRKKSDGIKDSFQNVGTTLTGIVYIGLFGAILTTIRQRYGFENIFRTDSEAGLFIITIFVTIWICDSAAYFIGKPFGKHKMSKFVSPNKSWEGAAAGFVFAVATSTAAKYLVLKTIDLKLVIGTGLIIGTLGQAGDFVESLFKREAGVKDSSDLIPGHGGVFDRFDSLLFSSPFIYLLLRFFR